MKKNHFQLKDQENSLERINSEINLTNLPDSEFKKGVNEYTEGVKKDY